MTPAKWRPVLSAAQIDLLTEHLDGRFGLDALWLFGSEAMGSAGPFSDIDLAGLFRRRPSALDVLDQRAVLGALLGRDIDLVDLERVSPIVAMQVFRRGRLLADANPRRRHQAVSSAVAVTRTCASCGERPSAPCSRGSGMVDRDVVTAKVATIDRCLQRISETRGERRVVLLPVEIEDIIVLNLQRAVKAAIDLATHVVSAEGYALPDSVAAFFSVLEGHGILEPPLAARLRRMVGFRNVAIHDYQTLDTGIVEAIVSRHLSDLRLFAARVVDRFGI
jgi:uncharacterized protein YutE (UPF0331/DUF86 family)/predicted nucleotidyltransferase